MSKVSSGMTMSTVLTSGIEKVTNPTASEPVSRGRLINGFSPCKSSHSPYADDIKAILVAS